jgi:hypothetical protein
MVICWKTIYSLRNLKRRNRAFILNINMKRLQFFLLLAFIMLISIETSAQELAPIYSARAYWLEQQNPRFKELLLRQLRADSLKPAELDWLNAYHQYLDDYYSKLTDDEKQVYKAKNAEWDQLASNRKPSINNPREGDQFSDAGDKSIYTKFLVQSGWFGFFYGGVINTLFDVSGSEAAGIPFLTAGASVLVPMLNYSNRQISNNSLMLSLHGKTIGWVHGFALSGIILGSGYHANNEKIVLTLGALSSIGLGYLGKELGKNENWSEGRVALYRHYGLLAPFSGASVLLAAGVNDNRIYGAGILASGFAGYYIADRIALHTDFTRGDILSIKSLTILNGCLGLGLWLDAGHANRGSSFLPALGAISGTVMGQYWLKDYKLTISAARKTVYATIGGSLIGEGLALIVNSDSPTPYYLIPWITGFVSYAIAVENFKTKPLAIIENRKGLFRNWTADFQPENLIIGSRMKPKDGASPMSMKIQPPPALVLRYTLR